MSDFTEIEAMENEAEEFVNLSLDTIDMQKSNNLKSSAAGVLEMMLDHIDGCTTYAC